MQVNDIFYHGFRKKYFRALSRLQIRCNDGQWHNGWLYEEVRYTPKGEIERYPDSILDARVDTEFGDSFVTILAS